jgi:WD40 repeat protein
MPLIVEDAQVAVFLSKEEGAMPTRSTFVLAFIYLGFVAEQSCHCEPPLRLDRYGDPLPPGVTARLGTERLTLADTGSELTFSPDGRRLAAYDYPDQLRIWEVSSGKELLHVKQQPTRWHGKLVYSPDGKTLAMGYGDEGAGAGKLCVWDAATGKELHRLGGRFGQRMPSSFHFSADGRSLFAGGHYRPLLCWDLAGGGTPRKIGDFSSTPFVAFSRDGKTATIGGYQEAHKERKWTFTRWDMASGKELGRRELTDAWKWSIALSPEGSILAQPQEDGKSIALLDPLTGRELARAHGCDYPVHIVFSADGAVMTCLSKDGVVRVWDTSTGKVQARFKALSTSINRIALSPDGKRLALTGRADHAIHVWDVAAGRELHSFADHRGMPLTVAFLKDGKEIATVSQDSGHVGPPVKEWAEWSLRRWDAATAEERAVTRSNPNGEILRLAFSADGRQLVTVIHDHTLHLWDVESGKELRSWKGPHWEIHPPAFSPDDKTVLAAHGSKIHRWETATGRELPAFELEGPRHRVPGCLPSPDGQTLMVWDLGGNDLTILLLDAASGKVKRRLRSNRMWQDHPAFSPDGRTIAIEEGGAVSLWETASGGSRGRLKEPRMIVGLAFSPDGRFLAAGGDPQSPVNLWDLATGRIAGSLRADCGRVRQLAFSRDGSRLAVVGDSGTVLVCNAVELCGKKKMEEIVKSITPSAEELKGLWAELSGADSTAAYRAVIKLGLSGPRGAEFLKARLKSDKTPEERRIAQLIADLDDDTFATREKASAELAKLGVRAEPALRRTLEGEVSAEARRRVKTLLERLGGSKEPLPSAELIRLRAVEALEANGSKEARQALTELSEQSTDAVLAKEAKASLARLRSRAKP